MDRKTETAETLRQGIDHGQAADKVDYPDPAAAPLGTDAEAGGHPVTAREAGIAHDQEIRRPPGRTEDDPNPGSGFGSMGRLVLPVTLVVVAILLLLWAYF
ncbi:hypothetical protein [Paracoccus sp. T5]|uniref:hypothetical protein n=1 Tax=Paracoccus sp. T5 TaxID=3402161 RepID=UPI003AEA8BDC